MNAILTPEEHDRQRRQVREWEEAWRLNGWAVRRRRWNRRMAGRR